MLSRCIVENVHPYHVTYLSNLYGILISKSLKAKSLLDKEGVNYQDPTIELIHDDEKDMYEDSKVVKDLYVSRVERSYKSACVDLKKSCNLEDYVRLYLFNDGSLGPNYLFRFIIHSWQKHGGFALFVFRPVVDLLRSATDYYFMLGSAFSKYREIYGDLSSFVQSLLESQVYLLNYENAILGKRREAKESLALAEVLKWFLSSELGILHTIPLSQVRALFIFAGTEPDRVLSWLEDSELTVSETSSRSPVDEMRTSLKKIVSHYGLPIKLRDLKERETCESLLKDFLKEEKICTLLKDLQIESWLIGLRKTLHSNRVKHVVYIINLILATFNGGYVCPLP